MTKITELHRKWMQQSDYRQAERMQTTQSAIARLESGRRLPSSRTLKRFAEATGTRLRISFESERAR